MKERVREFIEVGILLLLVLVGMTIAYNSGRTVEKSKFHENLCAVISDSSNSYEQCLIEKDMDSIYTQIMLKIDGTPYTLCNEEI